jgi:amino acid transporter
MTLPISRDAATPLRRALRATEYFTLAFGSMIGVGWVIVMDDWLARGGPGGAMLGFLAGGLAVIPVAYVYGRLTERLPDAGSEIAYTEAVFAPGVSFAVGWMMVLAYLIICPWEAIAVGQLAAYLVPELSAFELYQVAGQPVYLPHVVLGLGLTAVITTVNYRGVRLSATLQNLATFGLIAIFGAFVALGLAQGDVSNLRPIFPDDGRPAGALVSTLLVLQIVPYFLVGFESIPKCSEEAAADFDPRSFTGVTLLALGAGTFFYVVVIGVVALLQPWTELTREPFATLVAFERAFSSPLLARVVLVGALLSLIKVFNGNFLVATRLLFALGRRGLLGGGLGQVERRFGTPARAVLFVGSLTVLAIPFGRAILVPITEVGSLASAVGWLGTCLAFYYGAGHVATAGTRVVALSGAAVAGVLILMKLLIVVPGSFQLSEFAALAAWGGLGIVFWLRRRGPGAPDLPINPMNEKVTGG